MKYNFSPTITITIRYTVITLARTRTSFRTSLLPFSYYIYCCCAGFSGFFFQCVCVCVCVCECVCKEVFLFWCFICLGWLSHSWHLPQCNILTRGLRMSVVMWIPCLSQDIDICSLLDDFVLELLHSCPALWILVFFLLTFQWQQISQQSFDSWHRPKRA